MVRTPEKTMSIISNAIFAAGGAVACVCSQVVYAFVAKQVKSVEADAPAVATKAEAAVVAAVKKAV
jgi:hypothetical protein